MPLREFKARLIPEIKELNIFVKKNLLSTSFSGELTTSLKGKGIEFEDYRDYSVEDDAARIDWRASKRSQRLLVREYKLEVNFNIFFLIDTSESMLFASTPKLKCEYAAQVACSLFYGIIQTGNCVGFGLFNDGLIKIDKPLLGRKQFYTFSREVSNPINYGGKKNIAKAIQQLIGLLDKKALVIFISDFIVTDDNWVQYMKIMAERHEVIGIMVRDPRDLTLPKENLQLVIGDPFSNDSMYIDSKQYATIYEEYNQRQLNLIRTIFEHNKSSLLELSTKDPHLHSVLQFFKKRGARWR